MTFRRDKLQDAMLLIQDFMLEIEGTNEGENLLIGELGENNQSQNFRRDIELVNEVLRREALQEIARNEKRLKYFGRLYSRDSIFLILVVLFERKVKGIKTPMKYLQYSTGLPGATVVRSVQLLIKNKLARRLKMDADARISLIEIDEEIFNKLALYFTDVGNVRNKKFDYYGRRNKSAPNDEI